MNVTVFRRKISILLVVPGILLIMYETLASFLSSSFCYSRKKTYNKIKCVAGLYLLLFFHFGHEISNMDGISLLFCWMSLHNYAK